MASKSNSSIVSANIVVVQSNNTSVEKAPSTSSSPIEKLIALFIVISSSIYTMYIFLNNYILPTYKDYDTKLENVKIAFYPVITDLQAIQAISASNDSNKLTEIRKLILKLRSTDFKKFLDKQHVAGMVIAPNVYNEYVHPFNTLVDCVQNADYIPEKEKAAFPIRELAKFNLNLDQLRKDIPVKLSENQSSFRLFLYSFIPFDDISTHTYPEKWPCRGDGNP